MSIDTLNITSTLIYFTLLTGTIFIALNDAKIKLRIKVGMPKPLKSIEWGMKFAGIHLIVLSIILFFDTDFRYLLGITIDVGTYDAFSMLFIMPVYFIDMLPVFLITHSLLLPDPDLVKWGYTFGTAFYFLLGIGCYYLFRNRQKKKISGIRIKGTAPFFIDK